MAEQQQQIFEVIESVEVDRFIGDSATKDILNAGVFLKALGHEGGYRIFYPNQAEGRRDGDNVFVSTADNLRIVQ